jgi:hypothetical protein
MMMNKMKGKAAGKAGAGAGATANVGMNKMAGKTKKAKSSYGGTAKKKMK